MSVERTLDRLSDDARARLARVVDLLATHPAAPSAVRDRDQAWRVHIADSLTGLEVTELRPQAMIADVGAGAGFPGVVLAAALPGARVDLIESVGRKCEFMRRALSEAAIESASVVCERAETWAEAPPPDGGRDAYDVVVARAVGRLSTLSEFAAPLLHAGGVLVAWKGRRDSAEEEELGRAAGALAMEPERVLAVGASAGSEHRHLHVVRKTGPTPARLPRRPGMAKKRPFGRS